MRRLLPALVLALLVGPGLVAVADAAPIAFVRVGTGSAYLCVEAGASTAVVFDVVDARTGRVLESVSTAPSAGGCPGGAATTAFRPAFSGFGPLAGTVVRATPAGSPVPVTIPVPYGAWDPGPGGTSRVVHLRSLPQNATIDRGTGPIVTSGGFYDGAAPVDPVHPVAVTATLPGAISFVATTAALPSAVFESWFAGIRVPNPDPLGGAVTVTVGTGPDAYTTSATPVVGRPLGIVLPHRVRNGESIRVVQDGWFDHAGVAPTAAINPDGFRATIQPGSTGQYRYSLALTDPAVARPPMDPLVCVDLGPALHVQGACGTPVDRFDVTATGLFVGAGDTLNVQQTSASLDTLEVAATAPGFVVQRVSSDDVEYVSGGHETGRAVLFASRPASARADEAEVSTAVTVEDGLVCPLCLDPASLPITLSPGVSLALSGGVLSGSRTYRVTLDAVATPDGVSGHAAPGARVLVWARRLDSDARAFAVAAVDGSFAVTLADPYEGEDVVVTAVTPTGHDTESVELSWGATATITSQRDRDPVRGTIHLAATAPGASVVDWFGPLRAQRTVAPFGVALDTTALPDGPVRVGLEAYTPGGGRSWAGTYLVVDNTPPRTTLPASWRANGRGTVFIRPGAADATSGVASIVIDWRDGHRTTAHDTTSTATPYVHTYRRRPAAGYRIRVTIRDRAGNTKVAYCLVRFR
jgi:hypothetical protein